LTAFNLRSNEDGELISIQLVYAQTGESSIFDASSRRLLNDSANETQAATNSTGVGESVETQPESNDAEGNDNSVNGSNETDNTEAN